MRVLAGILFSLGLVLVVLGGAELFTGNNLIVMAWASGRVSTRALVRNWAIVFAGNFALAVALGVLCNTLVCLAIWLTLSARSTADRILAIVPPLSAFVAAGFEHSIANMYFLPFGHLVATLDPGFVATHGLEGEAHALTWIGFLVCNLLPVTIGNLIGGVLLVGLVYWFVYLRPRGA
jgi:formate/nitrite transporter FocA (FNT family)